MSDNKLTSIVFIIPWIGKFPDYFQLWLNSCAENPTVDFLIFTDDKTKYNYPKNVKVYYTDFKALHKKFQQNFDFKISLNKPYKFCDFKPTYGEVFQEYIKYYDFWGHCDIDLIWGDIRKFLTESILSKYNRIFNEGHCCLYKNTPEINSWYRTMPANGFQNWKDVFKTDDIRAFDEWGMHYGGGMSHILESNGVESYKEIVLADVSYRKGWFRVNRIDKFSKFKDGYVVYNKGHIYFCNKNNNKIIKEFIYAHFQKRNFKIDKNIKEPIYFIAPDIITSDKRKISKSRFWAKTMFEFKFNLRRIKRKLSL